MITVHEFARRVTTSATMQVASADVMRSAAAEGVHLSPESGVDAALAQWLLDRLAPTVPVTGVSIVAPDWVPPSTRPSSPVVPPVVFSNPGAVDGPSDPPMRPVGRTGQRSPRPASDHSRHRGR
jgi:hypothetical protein